MYHLKPKLCVGCFCYIGIIIHILLFIIWVWKWDQQWIWGYPMIKQTHIWFDAILSRLVLWTQQLCRREGSRQPHAVQDGFVLNEVYLETPTKTSLEIMGTLRFPFIFFQVDFDMLWPALSKWCWHMLTILWPLYGHLVLCLSEELEFLRS